MIYLIAVTQEQKMTLEGTLSIEASSEEEALKIANEMTQEELEYQNIDWQQGDSSEFESIGDIIITDEFIEKA